jgi:hypothetical protein
VDLLHSRSWIAVEQAIWLQCVIIISLSHAVVKHFDILTGDDGSRECSHPAVSNYCQRMGFAVQSCHRKPASYDAISFRRLK